MPIFMSNFIAKFFIAEFLSNFKASVFEHELELGDFAPRGLLREAKPKYKKGLSLTIWSFNFGGEFYCHKAAYYLV